jgi:hypothetical protein
MAQRSNRTMPVVDDGVPADGRRSVQSRTFNRVESLTKLGRTKRFAFEIVAAQDARSVSAVQAAYYAEARKRRKTERKGLSNHDLAILRRAEIRPQPALVSLDAALADPDAFRFHERQHIS